MSRRLPNGDVLFGEPADFAIQAGVEPEEPPGSMYWGHAGVWCRGVALGRHDEPYCGLGAFREHLVEFVDRLPELWDDELYGVPEERLFDVLWPKCYGPDDDRTLEQIHADAARFGKFDFLINWGEQFDGYRAFVVYPPGGRAVVIIYELPDGMRGTAAVTLEGFRTAIADFVRWFDAQAERLWY